MLNNTEKYFNYSKTKAKDSLQTLKIFIFINFGQKQLANNLIKINEFTE